MPPNLSRAHQTLDRAVDRLYRPSGFASERERIEHLFMRYENMRAPLGAVMAGETETAAVTWQIDQSGAMKPDEAMW